MIDNLDQNLYKGTVSYTLHWCRLSAASILLHQLRRGRHSLEMAALTLVLLAIQLLVLVNLIMICICMHGGIFGTIVLRNIKFLWNSFSPTCINQVALDRAGEILLGKL